MFEKFLTLNLMLHEKLDFVVLLGKVDSNKLIRGCLSDSWKPSFLPLLIFDWRTFSRRVTAWW